MSSNPNKEKKGMKPITKAILTVLIPFSQLFIRIFTLDGSLDKAWLLIPIFYVLPLSLVPGYFMWRDKIKPGQGGKPIDWYMIIPIVTNLIMKFITTTFSMNKILAFVLKLIVPMLSAIIAYYIRDSINCKKREQKTVPFMKTVFNGITVQSISGLSNFILQIVLPFIPFIGSAIRIIKRLPLIGGLFNYILYILFYITTYAIVNMVNGIDAKKYCSKSETKTFADRARTISAIVGFIIITILTLLERI